MKILILLIAALALTGCPKRPTTPGPVMGQAKFKKEVRFLPIHFKRESSKLEGGAILELLTDLDLLRKNGITKFTVSGYSCEELTPFTNRKLSEERTATVMKALWNFGLDTASATTAAYNGKSGIDCGVVIITETQN